MPFITSASRAPSPSLSPVSPTNTATMQQSKSQQPSPISYIPPLIDGACGTIPAAVSQSSPMPSLKADLRILAGMGTILAKDIYRTLAFHRKDMSWREMGEVLLQAALCTFEAYVLLAALPLWLCLPGSFFVGWSVFCAAVVMGASSFLNVKERVLRQKAPAGTEGYAAGGEERWIYVGGLGVSTNTLATTTLPKLSTLFSRPITAIPSQTHGLLFDLLLLTLQRALNLTTPQSHALYTELRTALLAPPTSKLVLLASSSGAIPASRALAQLYADFPADKIGRLEVYTFGSLATDFVIPLGGDPHKSMAMGGGAPPSPPMEGGGGGHHLVVDRREPHIEHYAHTADPLSTHLGVLRSVRNDLSSRYCGGVFVLGSQPCHRSCTGRPAPAVLGIEGYLECLFPHEMAGKGAPGKGMLDSTMSIERDVAEKREFAAMASFASSTAGAEEGGSGRRKRLSWTGLGATANGGTMDGAWGLEMARRGCRDCDGHKGREVSWLVRYVGGKGGMVNGAKGGLGMEYGGSFGVEGSMVM